MVNSESCLGQLSCGERAGGGGQGGILDGIKGSKRSMAHTYDVGTKAWQPDSTEGWVASEVTEKKVRGDKVLLVFLLENGEV